MAKRILIIGNSDGIGAATTAALVARGDRVIGVSRSPSPLVPAARGDESPRHEVMDVTDLAYRELLGRLVRQAGPFDACIYCVGVGSEFDLSDLSHEARVFEVNLTAMVRTLEILLPPWLERGTGHFIGLSSMADTLLNPGRLRIRPPRLDSATICSAWGSGSGRMGSRSPMSASGSSTPRWPKRRASR